MATTESMILMTLCCNGAWSPVYPAFQVNGNKAEFRAYRSTAVVVSPLGTRFTGRWDLSTEQGRRNIEIFARSLTHRGQWAKVVEVPAYWYVPAFGPVNEAGECVEV